MNHVGFKYIGSVFLGIFLLVSSSIQLQAQESQYIEALDAQTVIVQDIKEPLIDSYTRITTNTNGFTDSLIQYDGFGGEITNIGDLDNDGVDDLMIYMSGNSSLRQLYVFLMNSSGTVKSFQRIDQNNGGGSLPLFDTGNQLGIAMDGIGDFNGDGVEDVILGGQYYDADNPNDGAVIFAYMNTNGTINSTDVLDNTDPLLGSLIQNDQFGAGVSSIGDIDGDGVVDLAVGATGDDTDGNSAGAVYILLMNNNATIKSLNKITNSTLGFNETLKSGDQFGKNITNIGDLDGDGVNDIAVSSDNDINGVYYGATYIIFLNNDGSVKDSNKLYFGNGIDPIAGQPTGFNNSIGSDIAGMGDLDNDGVRDIALGWALYDGAGDRQGAVLLLFMNSDGSVKSQQLMAKDLGTAPTEIQDLDTFGRSVENLGDINGDGSTDIAIGSNGIDGSSGVAEGGIYIVNLQEFAPQIIINPQGSLSLDEESSPVTIDVSLSHQPSFDVVVAISNSDSSKLTNDLSQLTFTSSNWNTPQQITLTPISDTDGTDELVTLQFTITEELSDGMYADILPLDYLVTVDDDEVDGLIISDYVDNDFLENSGSIIEYTVELGSVPASPVEVNVNLGGGRLSLITVTPLLFDSSNWDVPQTVQFEIVPDTDAVDYEEEIEFEVIQPGGGVYNNYIDYRYVDIIDTDVPGILITPTQNTVATGSTGNTFEVSLLTEPAWDVTVDLSLDLTGIITLDQTQLTFTVGSRGVLGNWATPQTVTFVGDAPGEVVVNALSSQFGLGNIEYNGLTTSTNITVINDNDGDMVSDDIEDLAPNGGDGNGDGTLDSAQLDVSSIVSPITSEYMTLEVAGDCNQVNGFEVLSETDLPVQDPDEEYDLGLHEFRLLCNNPGESATVTMIFDRQYDTSEWCYKKFDGTDYIDITDDVTITERDINGVIHTIVTYEVTDGGVFDIDGIANSEIHDPAGPFVHEPVDDESRDTLLDPSIDNLIRTGGYRATKNIIPIIVSMIMAGWVSRQFWIWYTR